ncbi:malonic semialdehyde reductase [compost metagenome]
MSTDNISTILAFDQQSEEVSTHRQADHAVHPIFINRWSPRAYSNQLVSDDVLHTVLEAARWAPSSNNIQPWRFIIAKTEEQLKIFQSFINPNNRLWSDHAPILIVLASNKLNANGGPNGAHAFDTGAAWGSLALQASLLGLITHAIGGFDREQARTLLNVPDELELHAVIALGYRGDKESLPEALQEREKPNGRKPISESIWEFKSE